MDTLIEQQTYKKHEAELMQRYPRQYVVIVGQEIVGQYDDFHAASRAGAEFTKGERKCFIRKIDGPRGELILRTVQNF